MKKSLKVELVDDLYSMSSFPFFGGKSTALGPKIMTEQQKKNGCG
jgi:hypothetical protein